jgi:hypothetical protein
LQQTLRHTTHLALTVPRPWPWLPLPISQWIMDSFIGCIDSCSDNTAPGNAYVKRAPFKGALQLARLVTFNPETRSMALFPIDESRRLRHQKVGVACVVYYFASPGPLKGRAEDDGVRGMIGDKIGCAQADRAGAGGGGRRRMGMWIDRVNCLQRTLGLAVLPLPAAPLYFHHLHFVARLLCQPVQVHQCKFTPLPATCMCLPQTHFPHTARGHHKSDPTTWRGALDPFERVAHRSYAQPALRCRHCCRQRLTRPHAAA